MSFNENAIEIRIINMIRNSKIYKNKNYQSEGEWPLPNPQVEQTFKAICNFGDENENIN
jgi:radical SAM superfamily enzyme with C-terminal helix-hairpin-helix motif